MNSNSNLQQFLLALLLERTESLFIIGGELPSLIFELLQLLKFGRRLHVADLIVQSQERHRRLDSLARFRRQTDHL